MNYRKKSCKSKIKSKPKKIIKIKKENKTNKEDQNLINLSKKICKIIHSSNKEFIQKWLEVSLNQKLNSLIEDAIVKEFKTEVTPLILKEIDKKIKKETDQINQHICNLKNNMIKILQSSL